MLPANLTFSSSQNAQCHGCKKISGIGSNMLSIAGVELFGGTEHRMLPWDMIEAGILHRHGRHDNKSDITIKIAGIEHLGIIPEKFQQPRHRLNFKGDDIHPAQEFYEVQKYLGRRCVTVYDHLARFTPDLLSIVPVTGHTGKGSVLIHRKCLKAACSLLINSSTWAQIILCDPHRTVVIGLEREQQLRGITVSSRIYGPRDRH